MWPHTLDAATTKIEPDMCRSVHLSKYYSLETIARTVEGVTRLVMCTVNKWREKGPKRTSLMSGTVPPCSMTVKSQAFYGPSHCAV